LFSLVATTTANQAEEEELPSIAAIVFFLSLKCSIVFTGSACNGTNTT